MASELFEKVTCFLQQNKYIMALKDRGEQWLTKSPESWRVRGLHLLDTTLMLAQRIVVAVLVLLGRDVQHPTDKPAGFIGFVPTVVRLLRNAYYAMKLVRKWAGNECGDNTPKPLSAVRPVRNMLTSQLHSTPKRMGLGEKMTPVRKDAKPEAVSVPSTNPVNRSTAVDDSPDGAASTSMAGLSAFAGWFFNGMSGYIEDNDVDVDADNEDNQTSANESQEFRSVTDSDEDPVSSSRSAPLGEEALHIDESTKANGHI